jgi:hypothetical protein
MPDAPADDTNALAEQVLAQPDLTHLVTTPLRMPQHPATGHLIAASCSHDHTARAGLSTRLHASSTIGCGTEV